MGALDGRRDSVETANWMRPETIDYLRGVKRQLSGKQPREVFDRVLDLTQTDQQWRERECINLMPSENVMSETIRRAYGSNQMFRVCDGPLGAKDALSGGGDRYLEEIEGILLESASRLFGAKFVEHRPLSGVLGCLAVNLAFTKPGDRIMSVSLQDGGNPCSTQEGFPGKYGLDVSSIPIQPDTFDIALEAFEARAREVRPKLIVIGTMMQLFPYPLEELRRVAHEAGAVLFYDAAHFGAFFAAGVMSDPLRAGVDVLLVNTHKMFGGPFGSFLLTNDENIAGQLNDATYLRISQTPHGSRIVALALSVAEMLEHARPYSEQIVSNAKALATALDREGILVMARERGFTESHMLVFDARPYGGGQAVEEKLTQANIIANKMPLPLDAQLATAGEDRPAHGSHLVSGYRLGTPWVTRVGMKEGEMEQVARFIRRVLIDGHAPSDVAKEVAHFMQNYQKVHYSFDD